MRMAIVHSSFEPARCHKYIQIHTVVVTYYHTMVVLNLHQHATVGKFDTSAFSHAFEVITGINLTDNTATDVLVSIFIHTICDVAHVL